MDMEEKTCDCPDPKICQELKMHIRGRLWEIWNNVNIDPSVAEKYRDLWRRQATAGKIPPKEVKPMAEPKRGGDCGCRKS
jgi:hypothetical protein